MEVIIKYAKRTVVSIFGFILLAIGIIMLFTPGPGWLFIIIGLGVLAEEYVWAHQLLHKAKHHYEQGKQKAKDRLKHRNQAKTKKSGLNNK